MTELITQYDAGMAYTGPVFDEVQALAYPDEEWFFDAISWGRSDSGERVNPSTALSHGPVWQAVNILAGDVGQLPIHIYRKRGRSRERDDQHPVDWLLTMEPNPFQTPAVWKETMMAWALLWGNGCSYIVRDGAGRPTDLIPLQPDRTYPRSVEMVGEDGTKWNEWWIETDFGDGKRVPLPYRDVFHVRGLATDGFWGLSAVHVAKNVIGGGLALRKHGNRTFKNNANPHLALISEGKQPAPEVLANYREELRKYHAGAENAGNWLMLFGGTKPMPLTMSNTDAQWLEAMDIDREFVAALFNLPPYKLGAMKNSAVRANLEQQNTDYLNTSLSRHLIKIKEEIERKLFNYGERRLRRVFAKWVTEAFLRGDLAARGAYYSQAKTGEWMTTNEIRELEDMNPIAGGDELRNPAINPAGPSEPSEPPRRRDDPQPDEEAQDAARELIAKQVAALLDAEAKAVQKACHDEPNVVKWAEHYYESYQRAAGHFLEAGCRLAAALGCGPCDWTTACGLHARDSLNRLLAMSGICTKEGLPAVGRELAGAIRGQADYLMNSICGAK